MSEPEWVDAVVVGSRIAGSAAAIALARRGLHVVALDRVEFPADTISTHLLWPSGLAEIQKLGALDRVRALGAPEMPVAFGSGGGGIVRSGFTPVDGIDHAMCVRRIGLDAQLVATARDAGADVRERCRVTELVRSGDRVAGVRYEDADDEVRELRASLVVGADGRRSTVARLLGVDKPYRAQPSGRACFYSYWRDARDDWRHVAAQFRAGAELGTSFPCDDGLVLVLLQPPANRADDFKGDLEGEYRRTIAAIPELAERLEGSDLATKVRSATGIESYFRRSSGRGWALAGDAGHFKDPVTAQGIRDALRFGRLLGEAAASVVDYPAALDRALAAWERRLERECLETYQWTNIVARGEPMTPIEIELYRRAENEPDLARDLTDVFSRTRRPAQVFTARRALRAAAAATAHHPGEAGAVIGHLACDMRVAVGNSIERGRARYFPSARRTSSGHGAARRDSGSMHTATMRPVATGSPSWESRKS